MNFKSFGYVRSTLTLLDRLNDYLGLELGLEFPAVGYHVLVVLVFQRSTLTIGGIFE
jgi:hypothetical protein